MYRHFLQSSAWKSFLESEKKTVFVEESPDFSYLAVLEPTKLGPYLYCPYGPCLKDDPSDPSAAESSFRLALESLKSLAEKEGCFFIRVEPTVPFPPEFFESKKFKKSTDLNPAHTWLLDLSASREEILTNMSQGTRTRHNQFSKKGLSVEVTTDPSRISELTRLQHKLAREKGLTTFSDSYLKNELSQPFSSLYLVHYTPAPSDTDKNPADRVIAASLFFDDEENQVRFYMQSAADSDYKRLPATVGLLTSSIFDAKEKGLKYFDFWGIAPDDAGPDHPWSGFTAFKKSFGGFAKNYSGTYDLPLDSKKYSLYTSLRRLNRLLRHKF